MAAAVVLLGGAPPAAAAGGRAIKIVQLGDSYSAGNAAGNYYGPTGCYRSHDSWADEYATWLKDQGDHVTYLSRACGGGVVANIQDPRTIDGPPILYPTSNPTLALSLARVDRRCTGSDPVDYSRAEPIVVPLPGTGGTFVRCDIVLRPQIDAVGADTDLVVLTMGGNDIGFEGIVAECFARVLRDPGGCRTKQEDARLLLPGFQTNLRNALIALKAKMRPDAQIVLLSYPHLSTEASYVLRSLRDRLPFVEGDTIDVAATVRSLGVEGDRAQREAVAAANAADPTTPVTYADGVKSLFAGHEPDPSPDSRNPDRWINEFEGWPKQVWYHPTATGHFQESTLLRPLSVPSRAPEPGSASLDLVFVIDTTGSMGGILEQVKDYTTRMVDLLAASTGSYRFGLVTYRDDPTWTGDGADYPARLDLPFTTDTEAIRTALASMEADGGGDVPETALAGVDTAVSMPWRAGVKKVAVVIGDAAAHDPEPVSGLTSSEVARRALEVDPVEVFPVSVSGGEDLGSSLTELAAATGGQVSTEGADVTETLSAIIGDALDKPYAWLDGPWVIPVGGTVDLDARGSYATSGEIVRYEWDFDSDGTVDTTTPDGRINHIYGAAFDGFTTVRVVDAADRSSLATTLVLVTSDGDDVPDDTDNCPAVANATQSDLDLDMVGDECDPSPVPAPPATDTVVFGPDQRPAIATGSLSGTVTSSSGGAAGTVVTLNGEDAGGEPVAVDVVAASDGSFVAGGLLPGIYRLSVPSATVTTVGTVTDTAGEGSSPGTAGGNSVDDIVLSGLGASATGYGFALSDAAPDPSPEPPAPSASPMPAGGGAPSLGGARPTAQPSGGRAVTQAAPARRLPTTGGEFGVLLPASVVLVVAGAGLVIVARRARPARRHR